MKYRILYTLTGFLVGAGVWLNWVLWRAFSAHQAYWTAWFRSEMHKNGSTYIVLAIGTMGLFSFIGALLGRRNDRLVKESIKVLGHNVTLNELATTDELTGLFNLRYLQEMLSVEIENAGQSPLTCLLLDIDHFKKINDNYGHPFGDIVLSSIAKIIKKQVRLVDTVGRLGGEEFIVVLPNKSTDRALAIANRIRDAVQTENFEFEKKRITVTVSVGVVTYPQAGLRNKADLLRAVDDALYQAKRTGRNRVVVWETEKKEPTEIS